PANRELLEQAVAEVVGPEAAWTRTRGQGRRRAAGAEAGEAPAAGAGAKKAPSPEEDETVQAVLDIFQDTVERVEPNEEG
ncbi:MAG TPA: hypothetical protein VF150_05525, partial [Thermoanaerobaculia bacterium]